VRTWAFEVSQDYGFDLNHTDQKQRFSVACGSDVHSVDVWLVSLDTNEEDLKLLQKTLSPDELALADQFQFPKQRDRFIAGRGKCRNVLSQYVDCDAGEMRFEYGANGKPYLSNSEISFSYSRSHEFGCLGVTRNRAIGVDLERINPDVASDRIPENFFSQSEAKALRVLPAKIQQQAFFHCWTRKEAYLKALGCGLSQELSSVEVPVNVDGHCGYVGSKEFLCSVFTFVPAPEFVAAIALGILPDTDSERIGLAKCSAKATLNHPLTRHLL
jgi:4'-phosphopantetheinyl transferase